MTAKGLFGLFLSTVGALSGEYAVFVIYDDRKPLAFAPPRFDYAFPLEMHEIRMIVLLIGSVVCFLIGIFLFYTAVSAPRTKDSRKNR